ncbi:MAG: tetratricopeptide repeat protein, partial [Planctomycetales bacterium]|nr:tetratricopeptide repeat protein [Planctomycetales bacterium]
MLEIDRPADALQVLMRLREQQPGDPQITADLVLAYARIGDEGLATENVSQLERLGGLKQTERKTLADTLFREGHQRLAMNVYQQMVSIDPNDLQAWAHLVRSQVALLDFPAAKATLDALGTNATNRLIRLEAASYKTAVGEHSGAYAIYQALLAEEDANDHTRDVDAIKGLGTLYYAMSDFHGAEAYFRQGVTLAPKDSQLKQLLAEALLKQHKVEEAVAVVESVVSAEVQDSRRQSSTNAVAVADILLRGHEYQAVELICRNGLAEATNARTVADLRTMLGLAQLKMGRVGEAFDTLSITMGQPGGDSAKLRYGLYRCYQRLGQNANAERILANELRMFGPATRERIEVAQLAMEDCDGVLAERVLTQAQMFDSANPLVGVLLAEARAMVCRRSGGCTD